MDGFHHKSVLKDEVVACLAPARGGLFVDGTLGGGGHAEAILEAGPTAQLIGFDRDPDAIEASRTRLSRYIDAGRVEIIQATYDHIAEELEAREVKAAGLVIDAGVSSHQLDVAERGFSFSQDGPLDMRMSQDGDSAADLLDRWDERELTRVLREYGEVKGAGRLAGRILRARRDGDLATTSDLAGLCGRPKPGRVHPATQVFQAIRIAVNGELEGLRKVVADLPEILESGGRCAFISFHSLEDRIVKRGLREHTRVAALPAGVPVRDGEGPQPLLTTSGKAIKASDAEIEDNPRARSARLRCAERTTASR